MSRVDDIPLNPGRMFSARLSVTPDPDAPRGTPEYVGETLRVHPENILTSLRVDLVGIRYGAGRDRFFVWLTGPTGHRKVGGGGSGGGVPVIQSANLGIAALCDLTQEGSYELRVVQAGTEATVAEFRFEVVHDLEARQNPPYFGPDE